MSRRAAEVQHYVVLLIRERIEFDRRSWTTVADRSTLSYDALMEIVRGEQHMGMVEVIDLSSQFGPLLVASQQLRQAAGLVEMGWPMPGSA